MPVTSINLDLATEAMLIELVPESRQRSAYIRGLIAHAHKQKARRVEMTRKYYEPKGRKPATTKGKTK